MICVIFLQLGAAESSPEDNDDKYLDYMYQCEEMSLTDQYLTGLYLCAVFSIYLFLSLSSATVCEFRATAGTGSAVAL